MIRQIITKFRQLRPHTVMEQLGVLLWGISVLVIGLRLALIVPDLPTFRRVLELSATVLIGSVVALGLIIALVAIVRARRKRQAVIPTLVPILALCVDGLLAASIIRTALDWAGQGSLRGAWIGALIGLGLLHITLAAWHDHGARAYR